MNPEQKINFQTFYGLKELIITKHVMHERLRNLLDWSEIFSNPDNTNNNIKILDTFFSDTFPNELLSKVLRAGRKGYNIKILVLNPNSEAAKSRAEGLSLQPYEEINKTLNFILKEMRGIRRDQVYESIGYDKKRFEFEFISVQLNEIDKLSKEFNLEIKFYDILTQTPVYLISNFAAIGQMLYRSSAVDNPWMIFVNDETQKDDIFDTLSRNFDQIWEHSDFAPRLLLPKQNVVKNIFISHGHDQLALELIEKRVKKHDFVPTLYTNEHITGNYAFESVEKIIAVCQAAVILMSKDDFDSRARQNVIHELGWCQARFGREKVLVLAEEGIEIPSNIEGMEIKFNKQRPEQLREIIDFHLVQFENDKSSKK